MKSVKILAILSLMIFFSGTEVFNGYSVGDRIDDFRLMNVEGKMVSMSDYKSAKGFIIIFDCNTCPYSQAYLERIKGLHAKFNDKGYPVIAINSNDSQRSPGDSYEKMVSYANDHNYRHAYLYDESQVVASTFGATNTPQVFLVEKEENGELVLAYKGAIDNNTRNAEEADKKYVEDAIESLLKGEEPNPRSTKAIGCTIKWSEN